MPETKAIKNGYVYIYLSNEGNQPVYFDNFSVSDKKGQLIEEDNYYAYGLKINSISSRATTSSLSGKDATAFGYQGLFSEEIEEFDLNYNEFDLRTYDPQIGRWTGADPYDEFASPYTGMGNDPVNNVDPSGGNIFSFFSGLFSKGSGFIDCPTNIAGVATNVTMSTGATIACIASSSAAVFGSSLQTGMNTAAAGLVSNNVQ